MGMRWFEIFGLGEGAVLGGGGAVAVGQGKGEGDTCGRGGAEVCIFYLCLCMGGLRAARRGGRRLGFGEGLVKIARQVRCFFGGGGMRQRRR